MTPICKTLNSWKKVHITEIKNLPGLRGSDVMWTTRWSDNKQYITVLKGLKSSTFWTKWQWLGMALDISLQALSSSSADLYLLHSAFDFGRAWWFLLCAKLCTILLVTKMALCFQNRKSGRKVERKHNGSTMTWQSSKAVDLSASLHLSSRTPVRYNQSLLATQNILAHHYTR